MKSSIKTRKTVTGNETSIQNGDLYFEDICQCSMSDESFADIIEHKSVKAIRIESLASDWSIRVFYEYSTAHENVNVEMTLRKEVRGLLAHWYAYRRVLGTLHKRYVGHSDQVTEKRILEIARKMPSR